MAEGEKPITRRSFLKMLAVSAATAVIPDVFKEHTPGQKEPQKDLPIVEKPKEVLLFDRDGVSVWTNEDRVPARWEDAKGNKGIFDTEAMAMVRQKSIEDRSDHVAQAVRVEIRGSKPKETSVPVEASKRILEPPSDILSKEELKKRNIEVIDSEKVGFHIRVSAFEKDGILEQYQEGSGRKLIVVIVDQPTITREGLRDPRYDPIRKVINDDIDSIKEGRNTILLDTSSNPLDNELARLVVPQITDQEFLNWGLLGVSGYALNKENERSDGEHDILFLAIAQSKNVRPETLNVLQIGVSATGSYKASVEPIKTSRFATRDRLFVLEDGQNHRPTESYKLLPAHREGTFEWKVLAGVDPKTTGPYFVAMHEAEHLNRFARLASLSEEPEGVERLRFFSEQETDWATRRRIELAYNHFRTTGDNSLYPFALENKQDGYFVIG